MLSILPFHLHLFIYLFVYIVNSIVSFLPKSENWQLIKAGKSEALNAATARKEQTKKKFSLRATLSSMFLTAFMLCQLPGRPLEEEGGERRQKDLKALGQFSIMSFLSNSAMNNKDQLQ